MRERINEIRNDLEGLQAKNGQLNEAQLSTTDMVVDTESGCQADNDLAVMITITMIDSNDRNDDNDSSNDKDDSNSSNEYVYILDIMVVILVAIDVACPRLRYINHLKEDMENQIEQVRFELAWSVEFHERGLEKLKDYYLKQVDFERIEALSIACSSRLLKGIL